MMISDKTDHGHANSDRVVAMSDHDKTCGVGCQDFNELDARAAARLKMSLGSYRQMMVETMARHAG
ncbi:hypothetical protein [Planctomycetes bacterium K23_9]|uniref:Uncharacterized protein n=1 Tax=Stieleria marina TaxID=1930275 RepID=A0A517NWC3_9BACT|nr:hypothetical protein K239x_34160 [Planctomycetes bacterium K23_9]